MLMKKNIAIFLLFICSLSAQADLSFMRNAQIEPQLKVQNTILAKVNSKTISVMDVMKKMDLIFFRNYPQLVDSKPAKYQFYVASWRRTLSEMIDTELILADAKDKELKLTDGEIREEMEERYGPNITQTLSQLDLSYDDTWQIVKNEMIVQRMNWFYVNSKALQKVGPKKIKDAYQAYCQQNPGVEKWKYQVISVHPDSDIEGEKLSEQVYKTVTKNQEDSMELTDLLEKHFDDSCVQISKEYEVTSDQISDSHHSILQELKDGEYSKPSVQYSRTSGKNIYRIFVLKDYSKTTPPPFSQLSNELRDQLLQEEVQKQASSYLEKLRKHYGYEQKHLSQMVSHDFEPFSFE